jgi:hypothetical protein
MGYRQASEMIRRHQGNELEDGFRITVEEPVPVRFEKAFEGHFPEQILEVPGEYRSLFSDGPGEYLFDFTGKGFVLKGGARKLPGVEEDADLYIEVYVDDVLIEEAVLPTSFQARRHEVCWKYNLQQGDHTVKLVWKDPVPGYRIDLNSVIVYGPEPAG